MTENWRDWRTTRGTHPSCHSLALSDAHTHTQTASSQKPLHKLSITWADRLFSNSAVWILLADSAAKCCNIFRGNKKPFKRTLNTSLWLKHKHEILKYLPANPSIYIFSIFSRTMFLPLLTFASTQSSMRLQHTLQCQCQALPWLTCLCFLCVALNLHKFGGAQL